MKTILAWNINDFPGQFLLSSEHNVYANVALQVIFIFLRNIIHNSSLPFMAKVKYLQRQLSQLTS